MTIIQGIVLGIIEGLTEFLPISSTAHLIIADKLLMVPASEFLKTFEISIQLGAILAVVIIYFKRVINNFNIVWKLLAAFIPTAIIGLILYKLVKDVLMENLLIISIALILGGAIIIIFENWYIKKTKPEITEDSDLNTISYRQAITLGIVQSLAIVPGVSRAGATIVGGLSLGITRKKIVEFSFLLAIPTMLAATVLDIYKNPTTFNGDQLIIWLFGFSASFVTAIIGVKFLIKYIQKNNFKIFGWYRIILGLLIIAFLYFK